MSGARFVEADLQVLAGPKGPALRVRNARLYRVGAGFSRPDFVEADLQVGLAGPKGTRRTCPKRPPYA